MTNPENPIVVALKEFFGPLIKVIGQLPPILAYGSVIIVALLMTTILGAVIPSTLVWLIGIVVVLVLLAFVWSTRQSNNTRSSRTKLNDPIELAIRVHEAGDRTHGIPGAQVKTSMSGVPNEIANQQGDVLFIIRDTSFLGEQVEISATAQNFKKGSLSTNPLKHKNELLFIPLEIASELKFEKKKVSDQRTASSPFASSNYVVLKKLEGTGPDSFQSGDRLITIGRSSANSLVVDHPQVSWEHGQIFIQEGAYRYRHVSKSNITTIQSRVNKSETLVKAGDTKDYLLFNQDRIVIGAGLAIFQISFNLLGESDIYVPTAGSPEVD